MTVKEGYILEGLEPVIAEVVSDTIVHAKQVFFVLFCYDNQAALLLLLLELEPFCFTINSGDSFCTLTSLFFNREELASNSSI